MPKPKIDRNIPIPPRYRKKTQDMVEHLLALKVGDSFLLPKTWPFPSLVNAAGYASVSISRRKVSGGYRIWRTA